MVFLNVQSLVQRELVKFCPKAALSSSEFFNSHPAVKGRNERMIWSKLGRLPAAADDFEL